MRADARLLVTAARNGRALACDVDATAFILAHPRGAYTAARTVAQTRIFDYDAHVQRLVDSTLAMQAAKGRSLEPRAVADALRPRTEATLRAAMNAFRRQFEAEPAQEFKVTVLVCPREDATQSVSEKELLESSDVYCHIGLLPPLRSGTVKLLVAGLPRQNAAAKDSAWVRERKAIYDAIPKDVEEVILMDPSTHALLEGSQTNFYAIRGGTVYTADDGILKGTVRSLVLEVCAASGIPVELTPPSLDQVEEWEGCFISSTSRLVLGAGSIEYDDPPTMQRRTRSFPANAALEHIISSVRSSVLRKSTIVFDDGASG
ncbi:hypothetical protein PybrP1_005809 [[Pythium] brassicae (nom. inval.)]|nr:hypothetical protein PybrP1_005809 [[Pythium] brassicae (nom. inval.)]